MALVNTNFSLNIIALDKIDHICFFFFFFLKKKRETLKKKLERIGMNQSSMDLNHDSVSLVEFLPSPCVELKWISMKLSPSQVKKNFFFKKKKKKKIIKIN